jgi:hypothetical protein
MKCVDKQGGQEFEFDEDLNNAVREYWDRRYNQLLHLYLSTPSDPKNKRATEGVWLFIPHRIIPPELVKRPPWDEARHSPIHVVIPKLKKNACRVPLNHPSRVPRHKKRLVFQRFITSLSIPQPREGETNSWNDRGFNRPSKKVASSSWYT